MKATVVTDASGRIIASAVPAEGKGDAPTHNRIVAKDPQHRVHEIEIPDELGKPESAKKLHDEYQVEGTDDKAKLVKRK